MDKQYIKSEFDRFFDFPSEDKSMVTSGSAKLFAEHIALPLEAEYQKLKRITDVCELKLSGILGTNEAMKNIENILFGGESAASFEKECVPLRAENEALKQEK